MITFVWGIFEAAISWLNNLTVLSPISFWKFAGICLLFSIAHMAQQIVEREK